MRQTKRNANKQFIYAAISTFHVQHKDVSVSLVSPFKVLSKDLLLKC